MTATYENIATTTLTTTASSVTFSSISGSYTDLVLIIYANSSSLVEGRIRVNSDSGSNYSDTRLFATSSPGSDRRSSQTSIQICEMTTNSDTISIIQFMNYSNTTTNKTVIYRSQRPAALLSAQVGLWRSTAAIDAIEFYPTAGTLSSGSTFTLYGIKAE